jgi:hypothetical protein
MSISDALMICATLLSPLIAVRVSSFLDKKAERKNRQHHVYKTLMATRAYNISSAHVEALNSIDLEFDQTIRSERKVIEYWRQYIDLLGNKALSPEQWNIKRFDLLIDLLYEIGTVLGYNIDKTQIKNGAYAPIAHGRIEDEQQNIRTKTLELLDGKRSLSVAIADKSIESSSRDSEEIT